jgi:hypothetical protein
VLTGRPSAAQFAAAAALAALVSGTMVGPAAVAAGPVDCPLGQTVCTVSVQGPAHVGSTRPARRTPASDVSPGCRIPAGRPDGGTAVPCSVPGFGSWDNSDGCYYQREPQPPPPSDPVWEGHTDGAIYTMTCHGVPGTGGGWVWRATPPAGTGAGVDAAVLAQRAIRELALQGPAIRMAPPPGSMGLVHAPVWMWTAITPTTWGPTSATVAVPGASVTAVARAQRITWAMGDGHTVTCTGPGTAYRPGLATTTSPTCGFVYERSSAGQPGDAYAVTAVTTWQITWAAAGQTGALTVTRTSRTSLRIGEMQVLT